PQLVDQVVLHQRAPELIAGRDDDLSVEFLLQLRDLGHYIALEHRRVVPVGMFEGGGHDVLGHVVQPVRQVATPGSPPCPEELVASSTQQPCLGAQRLVKRDLVPLFEVLAPELDEPAAEPEALLTVRVLDHSIERDVLRTAHHELSHFRSPSSVSSVTSDADDATSGNWAWINRPVRASAGVGTGLEVRQDAEEVTHVDQAPAELIARARAGDGEAFSALT